ncbi:MAG: tetratricopeptide repeat protein [Aquificaceae bacterium]|jgi:predicted negative regulator of RcsB-dependent stress response|uniref:tetratricopeptide repeat protein n=1 Tax=Hydrogenobacter sp. Uz 6-8 TaxID=3384828 RepID=UPI0030B7F351
MRDIILRVGAFLILPLILVGAFLLWKSYTNRKLQELAYKEYEIRKLLQAGNYMKAKELIDSASSKDSSFRSLFLSYELYMAEHTKDVKVNEEAVAHEVVKSLKDRELQSLYRERYAYELFKKGKNREALRELEGIREEDFNYVSALLLKAQVLRKEGRTQEAQALLKKIEEKFPNTYFANIAQALSLMGE